MEEILSLLLSNGIFVIIILYVVTTLVGRLLKNLAGVDTQDKRRAEPQPWLNPWDEGDREEPETLGQGITEGESFQESSSMSQTEVPEAPSLIRPVVRMKKKSQPRVSFTKDKWKKGIIMKEILDPPRSRQARRWNRPN